MLGRVAIVAAAACVGLIPTAPSAAAEGKRFEGRVLPFDIIVAIRNYGFCEDSRPSQIGVAVHGGTPADWLATATYIAERSIVADTSYATVEVYMATPWGDRPPTRSKLLAKAYYSGPDPKKSPWPDKQWDLFAAGHMPTIADVEFDALTNELLGQSDPNGDPDKQMNAADAKARRLLIRKYHLPAKWKPDRSAGLSGSDQIKTDRGSIVIGSTGDADASMTSLADCLRQASPYLFKGCPDRSDDYRFTP